MKKLLVASAVLASAVSFASSDSVNAAAANPATITISYDNQNHVYSLSAGTIAGSIGDTFTLVNNTAFGLFTIAPVTADLFYTNPPQGFQSGLCGAVVCMSDWNEAMIPDLILRIDAYGTVNLVNSNTQAGIGLITFVPQQAPIYIPTNSASLDPNGGSCTVGGEVRTTRFDVNGSQVRFPNSDVCRRPGYKLESWKSETTSAMPGDLVSTNGTLFVAQWTKLIPPPAPPGPATALVNFQCAPCSKADLWWGPSPTAGATYEVVLSTGKMTWSTTPVASAPNPGLAPFSLTGLTAGLSYRIEVFAVKDGVRSETGAPFAPVAQATPISLSEFFSSILQTPTNYADFVLAGAPAQCAITIADSGRTIVSGKPGVYANGTVTGLPTGEVLKVWVRFPGGTYAEGAAKPQVDSEGRFEWARKTGKKTYVYFTRASDDTCKSNSVIIPAN